MCVIYTYTWNINFNLLIFSTHKIVTKKCPISKVTFVQNLIHNVPIYNINQFCATYI